MCFICPYVVTDDIPHLSTCRLITFLRHDMELNLPGAVVLNSHTLFTLAIKGVYLSLITAFQFKNPA